jgi:hypothetical protein
MKESSKIALGVVAVLLIALVGLLLSRQPTVSDQDQIAAQLESARAAAQEYSASGVMNIVSADFKGQEPIANVDGLNLALRQFLNTKHEIRVTLSPPNVVVQGDSATSTSQVMVQDAETGEIMYDKPVTLSWRREDGHRFLIFPAKVWRVVGAQYQGDLAGFD